MTEGSMQRVAMVTGATGITGRHAVERLCASPDFHQVVTFSTRPLDLECPMEGAAVTELHLNLQNKEEVHSKIGELKSLFSPDTPVYIFHCAYKTTGNPEEDCSVNLSMLVNVVEGAEAAGASLAHVFSMQGTKYYGQQFLQPVKTPFNENDPRHIGPNFYFDLEDYMRARVADDTSWTWSALRPNPVCGFTSKSVMSLVVSLAVYCSIHKELDMALRFPGTETAYTEVMELCDAGLLADAMLFTALAPAAANSAFNINNGDYFRWEQMWPAIAAWFGLEVAPPLKIDLPGVMAGQKGTWEGMVKRHGLRNIPYDRLATWDFMEFVFQMPKGGWFSNTRRLQKAGFQKMVIDSKEMLLGQFRMLRDMKIIP